jgi:hypothetical protein
MPTGWGREGGRNGSGIMGWKVKRRMYGRQSGVGVKKEREGIDGRDRKTATAGIEESKEGNEKDGI